ncbi:hypothetical protein CS0771_21310 [Catellatospora sp. IY07-71]|nr:hypothetical protein CS0771_21310 [Catellatospora sp. IY07-71]
MNDPSGFATTDCDSVTDSATVTGLPSSFARADARASGDGSATGAATADAGTLNTPRASRPAAATETQR